MIVWGNSATGKLFCNGSRYYGATRKGIFLDSSRIGEKVKPLSRSQKVWTPAGRGGACMK